MCTPEVAKISDPAGIKKNDPVVNAIGKNDPVAGKYDPVFMPADGSTVGATGANSKFGEQPPEAPASGTQEAKTPSQAGSQGATMPDQQQMRQALQVLAAGISSSGTSLTGPKGVSPNLLNIGKNTLLGS